MRQKHCALAALYVCALLGWNQLCATLSQTSDVVAKPPAVAAVPNATSHPPQQRRREDVGRLPTTRPRATAKGAPKTEGAPTRLAVPTSVKPDLTAHVDVAVAHQGADGGCPKRRPYHTVLTAQATVYQSWQARIMYYHWKKQAAAGGPCTDMTGFTRLVASEDGKPDGLEAEMPSVFVKQMTPEELAKHGHFGVLNRPHSVQQMIDNGALGAIKEQYVYIAETDHVLMKPLPNLATETTPSAYSFGYMHASASVQPLVEKFSPGTSWRDVQPIGPSPVLISKAQLITLTPTWLQLSLALKRDPAADRRFGWVLEMWGYSIAAAQHGIKHKVQPEWQIEPGAGRSIPRSPANEPQHYIFHYTYGIEYSLAGNVQTGSIGEWSLDKRHYGVSYPPRKMAAPPARASESASWLLAAWNEASAAIVTWPDTKALGTVGWRRNKGDGIAGSAMAAKVMGSEWSWSGVTGLGFQPAGVLKTPWGSGIWGALPNQDYNDGGFCAADCLFADFSGALHNVRFDFSETPATFKTWRVGDGEQIVGKRT